MAELAYIRAGGSCPFTHPIYRFPAPEMTIASEVWKQVEGREPPVPANVDVWVEVRIPLECCNAEGVCVDPFSVGLLNCGSQPLPEPSGGLFAGVLLVFILWRKYGRTL